VSCDGVRPKEMQWPRRARVVLSQWEGLGGCEVVVERFGIVVWKERVARGRVGEFGRPIRDGSRTFMIVEDNRLLAEFQLTFLYEVVAIAPYSRRKGNKKP
jgi:hypothetical protein